ncbi:SDR family NAD(P)-dependent oxidoreductase [Novosphingobium sp. Leaf2]|uniref:SDR family NAD(P)-dependent oxidoreductase n=1 Tax=Novosphingobium sp. Leaf2 TaxID=1735670 RepID=UPI0006F233D0|nr:SDR family NAD(P)-dependent oxidoreductase [Novosphingobium sp. Leaf2]KQM21992.1 oxidoreductase [Novosphingobium sp. Leaf2]
MAERTHPAPILLCNAACAETHILITGASGGLGGALARHYAKSGVRLALWGRDMPRLESLAEQCRAAGAQVAIRAQDITAIDAAIKALLDDDSAHAIDLALFASGRGDIRAPDDLVEDAGLVALLGTVNFTAPAAMAAALGERMVQRGRGGIVLIGSAAGFHALPFAAAYAGTKAGLARFADALRLSVRRHGVTVTLVSPGFIDTAAGRTVPGPKPLLIAPDVMAARIAKAAARGRAHLITPWPFAVLRWLDRLLPTPLRDRLLLSLAPPRQ